MSTRLTYTSGDPGAETDAAFEAALEAARAAELRLGDPSDREAFVGPVINERSVERYVSAVAGG
ncbi:MAG: hypothetical protein QOF29_3293 [bacterium]|jgi:acyl-CoA reductase-like NAD-dependent aldehyde dehydrogenase